ncbi:hypothetical protein BGZ68_003906, partial [Mortierella alpina]
MAERSIAFYADLSTDLNVTQGSLTVAEWGGRWISEDTLKILSEKRILYAEQFFNDVKTELISWSSFRSRFDFKAKSTPSWYLELADTANREERSGETWCTEWIAGRRIQIQEAIAELERSLVSPEILTETESEDGPESIGESSSDEQTESEVEVLEVVPPPVAVADVVPRERRSFCLDDRASTKRIDETWRQRNDRKNKYIKENGPVRGRLTEYARDKLECEFEREERLEEKEW